MEMEHEAGNGRATIREVHQLLTDTRHENESMLKNMEERITYSVNASETRILAAVGDLGMRVTALEAWRSEQETSRAVSSAERSARRLYFREAMVWMEQHWKLIVGIAAIAFSLAAVVVDVDIHTK